MPLITKLRGLKARQQVLILFIFTIAVLYILAFLSASPSEIIRGMKNILQSRDVLITDYFSIAGVGGALFNAALVMTISLCILLTLRLNLSGTSIAAMFIMGGFALFGKNPLNILPILFGSYLYAKVQGVKLNRYIYVAFFATGLAPIISELTTILHFHPTVNLIIAICVGITIGYIAPPLSAHTLSMHMGYNLFNVGFAAGIIALTIVSVLRSFSMNINTVLIWSGSHSMVYIAIFYAYFAALALYGLFLCGFKLNPFFRILRHPGRAVADFVAMDGIGPTLVNMGVVGAFALTYIVVVGGDMSGPVVGSILTITGFAAFGVHIRNYWPILTGVMLATNLPSLSALNPGIQMAAIFSAGLAPIAGQFGIIPGIIAGFLHTSVVVAVGSLYGGMNLYNNGFAAGFVAIIMVPLMESFIKRYENK